MLVITRYLCTLCSFFCSRHIKPYARYTLRFSPLFLIFHGGGYYYRGHGSHAISYPAAALKLSHARGRYECSTVSVPSHHHLRWRPRSLAARPRTSHTSPLLDSDQQVAARGAAFAPDRPVAVCASRGRRRSLSPVHYTLEEQLGGRAERREGCALLPLSWISLHRCGSRDL